MKRNTIYSIMLLCALSACSGSDDEEQKDMQQPVISEQGITANPIDCQQYHRGDVIPFHYVMTDDQELGAYNIEIHNNFDHHTHSTTATECPMDAQKDPKNPWVYNRDFSIPSGQRTYDARHDIQIPTDIDPGDYHFMIRLTDRAGWQQLHAVAIKIVE
ncbi:protein of unknown function [Prevotella sp. khp7]|uniref:DUF4625 domain-containing protein n=1 Tax=Prevotella sp. khp7 TaxID=1761885 RepID=UPI0008CD063C|nr:DUF4625 domain-containing protein [Prevotella sp. khp7]SEW00681.1 protein of unknown function [Prevotella sp. khp7]